MIETYVFVINMKNLSNQHKLWARDIGKNSDKFMKEAIQQGGVYNLFEFQEMFNAGKCNNNNHKIMFIQE